MKKYIYSGIFLLVVGLMASVAVLTKQLRDERDERERYQNNTEALLDQTEKAFKTKEGKWAITVQALELEKKELERFREEDAKTITAMGVRLKRLEAMSNMTLQTDIEMTAPILNKPPNHSLNPILPDSIQLRTFQWSDDHTSIFGVISGDSVSCRYQSVVRLLQYVERIPKQFWFIKWGTKGFRQTVVSSNPHTQVIYNEYIRIK